MRPLIFLVRDNQLLGIAHVAQDRQVVCGNEYNGPSRFLGVDNPKSPYGLSSVSPQRLHDLRQCIPSCSALQQSWRLR